MHVNLLPGGIRRRLLIRRLVCFWGIVWLTCAVLWGGLAGIHYRALVLESRSLQDFEVRCNPIRKMFTETANLHQKLREAESRVSELRQLTPEDRTLPLLTIISQAAESLGGQMQVRRLTIHHAASEPKARNATETKSEGKLETGQFSVEAVGQSDDVADALLDRFRSSGVFRHVELKASADWGAAEDEQRKLDIHCVF